MKKLLPVIILLLLLKPLIADFNDAKLKTFKHTIETKEGIETYHLTVRLKYYLTLYSNGKVKYATLAKTTQIQGIYYKALDINFHPNGKVKSGYLEYQTEINGVIYGTNERVPYSLIRFYENGQLEEGYLAKKMTINNITYHNILPIKFYENGKFKGGCLEKNVTINNITYSTNSSIEFHENGKFKWGQLAQATEINGTTYDKDSSLYFNDKGKLVAKDVNLRNIEIEGVMYSYIVVMYLSGKIKAGVLAQDSIINGVSYKKDDALHFDENGKVVKVVNVGWAINLDENGKVE